MGTYMNHEVWIPQFEHPDVSGVTFGGFYMGKYHVSQPNATADNDNPDVADNAAVGSVPAISAPGKPAWRYINLLRARTAAANLGVGYHLTTEFEWASMAMYAQLMGTMPHGNCGDTNPPSDVTYTDETAFIDRAAIARGATYYAHLAGTGPNTWSHTHQADGVFDIMGMWQWNDGPLLCPASLNDNSTTPHAVTGAGGAGYPLVLGNLEVTLSGSPYGASTSAAAGSLTDSAKAWTTDEFAGMFLYDSAGALYYIDSNTADTLSIDGADTPATGPYTVRRVVATDITSGMSSGNRILTLRNTDADLKAFALPATSDGTGATKYGNDGYWFAPTALRGALRGGRWGGGARAGVFTLYLSDAPSISSSSIGLRVARSL